MWADLARFLVPVMSEQYLHDERGNLVAVLPAPASNETIFRAAYGMGEKDIVVALAEGDHWELTILAMEERPEGSLLRDLPYRLRDDGGKDATARLLEMAVLDLWDRGWTIKSPNNEEPWTISIPKRL